MSLNKHGQKPVRKCDSYSRGYEFIKQDCSTTGHSVLKNIHTDTDIRMGKTALVLT